MRVTKPPVDCPACPALVAPSRRCPGCDRVLPADHFGHDRSKPDHLAVKCLVCQREGRREAAAFTEQSRKLSHVLNGRSVGCACGANHSTEHEVLACPLRGVRPQTIPGPEAFKGLWDK